MPAANAPASSKMTATTSTESRTGVSKMPATGGGGTASAFPWGKDVGVGHAKCLDCGGDSAHGTAPTGSFRPNAFGVYDTAGNAAEWVQDCWNASYRGAPHDGSAWTSGDCTLRVLRGGSFANKANSLRSAARFKYDEDVRYYANGFRVARDLK